MNDQLAATKVTGVDSAFSGNAGSVQLAQNETTLEIEGATYNSGNFVTTSDGKSPAGMTVTESGVTVALQGNGKIGQVTLTSGSGEDNTVLSLEACRGAAEGDTFEITVEGVQAVDGSEQILDGSEVQVQQSVTAKFTDNVKVDVITLEGNATFADKTTAHTNELVTAQGTTVTAETLKVNNLANIQGNLDVDTLTIIDTSSKDDEGNSTKGVVAGTVKATTFTAINIALSNTVGVTKLDAANVEITETSNVTASTATLSGENDINGILEATTSATLAAGSITNVYNSLTTKDLTLAGTSANLNVLDGTVIAEKVSGITGYCN